MGKSKGGPQFMRTPVSKDLLTSCIVAKLNAPIHWGTGIQDTSESLETNIVSRPFVDL